MKRRLSPRELIIQHLGKECRSCKSTEHLELDHIAPLYLGGSDSIDNLELLCRSCHRQKHGIGIEDGPKEKFTVSLSPEIIERFRKAAFEKYGPIRGAITLALSEAMDDFSEKVESQKIKLSQN